VQLLLFWSGNASSHHNDDCVCARLDKERENAAALEVLPDLLGELDGMAPRARLTSLIEGVLAANIFDWGAKACVDLYHNGTILEIYR
jgi:type II pantothenate kinase